MAEKKGSGQTYRMGTNEWHEKVAEITISGGISVDEALRLKQQAQREQERKQREEAQKKANS